MAKILPNTEKADLESFVCDYAIIILIYNHLINVVKCNPIVCNSTLKTISLFFRLFRIEYWTAIKFISHESLLKMDLEIESPKFSYQLKG